MFGQDEGAAVAAPNYKNVWEPWMLYDTALIGTGVDQGQNWYADFVQLANAPEVPFLNVRTSSSAGSAYTNITSRDKMPWPFLLHSLGIRFLYPDPNVNNASTHSAIAAGTKIFQQILQEHCWFELEIREDTVLKAKPTHLPSGLGVTGFVSGNNAQNNWMYTTLTNGAPYLGNRWKFVGKELQIPRETPVRGKLFFSQYGKDLLGQLDAVSGFDFKGETAWPNIALIELTLLGLRGVQQRGELHYS